MGEKVMKKKQDRDVRKSERCPKELEGSLGCRFEEIETRSKRDTSWSQKAHQGVDMRKRRHKVKEFTIQGGNTKGLSNYI